MPEELHVKTQALIKDIEKKDRRFRIAQSVFTLLILLVLVGVITAQYRTLNGVQNQLSQQKQIAAAADKRSNDQQATILRRLDCMTVFFSQKDRTNLSISNIDRCTLDKNGQFQQFFTQQPGKAPQTTKTPQPSTGEPSNLTPSTPSQGESATPTPTVPAPPTPIQNVQDFVQMILHGVTSLLP